MDISKIDPGFPNKVNILITSEKGSKDYCVFDEKSEMFILKKVLSEPFPGFYGFVPRTHHVDGEPLDVLVLTSESFKQGIVIQARPIGLIRLRGNIPDDILITMLDTETRDLLSLNKEEIESLKNFLEEFKGKEVENVFGVEHARKAVERSIELYKREFEWKNILNQL